MRSLIRSPLIETGPCNAPGLELLALEVLLARPDARTTVCVPRTLQYAHQSSSKLY